MKPVLRPSVAAVVVAAASATVVETAGGAGADGATATSRAYRRSFSKQKTFIINLPCVAPIRNGCLGCARGEVEPAVAVFRVGQVTVEAGLIRM